MSNAAVSKPSEDRSSARLAGEPWSLPQRVLFRFVCSYFVLYALPERGRISIFNSIPWLGLLFQPYTALWHRICPWVGSHFFHLSGRPITYTFTGSGDTTLDYIQELLFVLVALAATLLWSVLDGKRPDYRRLQVWLRLLVRYTLALTLFGYGFAKIFPLQFPPPGLQKLIEPYGDFSPMGSLWWFMGASTPYVMFAGAAETFSGLLLLFRRTTTLGALSAFAVLLNVSVLNYCYDVPVKLYSTNLVFMAVYLAAPDLSRLFDLFVRNRATAAADLSAPRFARRWARISALTFNILFVGYVLFSSIYGGWRGYKAVYVNRPRPPIYGLYDVETFTRDGHDVPPLATDSTRWRRLIAEYPNFITIQTMDERTQGFQARYISAQHTLMLRNDRITYAVPDPDHLTLEGEVAGKHLSVHLRKIDTSHYLLLSRGFHWINEVPFNR